MNRELLSQIIALTLSVFILGVFFVLVYVFNVDWVVALVMNCILAAPAGAYSYDIADWILKRRVK